MAAAFRPIFCSSARTAMRPGMGHIGRQAPMRTYASEAKSSGGTQVLPMVLAVGGIGGLAAWIAMGGFEDNGKAVSGSSSSSAAVGALDKSVFKEFVLKEVRPYNHDSATYVFELPDNLKPGMRVASAVVVKGVGEGVKDKDGKDVIRPYTPVTSPDTAGHIDFLIKRYPNGAMTNHIHGLKPGDKLGIKGPIDKFEYKPNQFESIACIAGGSGITPMWQVMQSIAADPSDKTNVTLIYCNKTDKDILLKEQFDALAAKDSRFKIVYGLDKLSKGLKAPGDVFEGYATPEILSKYLPAPAKADKIKLFVCGPPPQVEAISGGKGAKGSQGELKGLLADLGYQPDQVYKF